MERSTLAAITHLQTMDLESSPREISGCLMSTLWSRTDRNQLFLLIRGRAVDAAWKDSRPLPLERQSVLSSFLRRDNSILGKYIDKEFACCLTSVRPPPVEISL